MPVYCGLLGGCEGASHAADGGSKRCCSPHHRLTPSQRILATVTLLPHCSRQRSAKLPSSITLFINQMADTSMDNTLHVNDAGYLLATARSVNILCYRALHFHTNCFPEITNNHPSSCVLTLNPQTRPDSTSCSADHYAT